MAKDLIVDLGRDRPGMFAKAAEAVGAAGVNIEGFCEVGGKLHILVSSAARAKTAVEKAGFKVVGERDVLIRRVLNKPGAGGRLLNRLAEAGVNIEFGYMATGTRVVLGVNDLKAAEKAAKRRG